MYASILKSKSKNVHTHFSPEPGSMSPGSECQSVPTLLFLQTCISLAETGTWSCQMDAAVQYTPWPHLFGDPDCGPSLPKPKPGWINGEKHQLSALVGCKGGWGCFNGHVFTDPDDVFHCLHNYNTAHQRKLCAGRSVHCCRECLGNR